MPPAESWYAELDRALADLGAEEQADPAWIGAREYTGGIADNVRGVPVPKREAGAQSLPDWLHRPAPKESRPPRPLAPSAIGDDRVADPPPPAALLEAARRGKLLHALFERLPTLPSQDRMDAGRRWLERSAGVTEPGQRDALVRDVCAIIADPAHAALFDPAGLAEAPIAAVLPDGMVVAGTVDRLVVHSNRILLVDFKTGRRVPGDAGSILDHHLRQMAAYTAALEIIFPDRPVEAYLLYTSGPSLIALPPALLATHKPGLGGAEQMLRLGG